MWHFLADGHANSGCHMVGQLDCFRQLMIERELQLIEESEQSSGRTSTGAKTATTKCRSLAKFQKVIIIVILFSCVIYKL